LEWAGHVSHMGGMRSGYKNFFWKPEGKRPLEKPRCGWEDNNRMDLTEMAERSGMDTFGSG